MNRIKVYFTSSNLILPFVLTVFCSLYSGEFSAQDEEYYPADNKVDSADLMVITTRDEVKHVGVIVYEDGREVRINTREKGIVVLKRSRIKQIKAYEGETPKVVEREFINEAFESHYLFNRNAFSLKKNEGVARYSLFGPNVHYGVSDRFDIGLSTSWLGIPIGASAHYSVPVTDNVTVGASGFLYTASWVSVFEGVFAPFGVITFGDKVNNFSFGGGYLMPYSPFQREGGAALYRAGGKIKLSQKLSFVFDSYILPSDRVTLVDPLSLLFANIRVNRKRGSAFSIGLMGLMYDYEILHIPIPMLQWSQKL